MILIIVLNSVIDPSKRVSNDLVPNLMHVFHPNVRAFLTIYWSPESEYLGYNLKSVFIISR